jgi:flavodoxin/Pyruvate/2-oxoacid:ferredoxin oxidoreductase delta subunit
MKTNLFYFSSTGNCLSVAKDIAAELPGTQIISIPKVMKQEIDFSADNIGIIFPVYYLGMPRIVIDFIKRMEPCLSKYIFAVCTYGGFAGSTLLQTQKQLKSKGLKLNAGFGIQMPGNYLVKYESFSVERQNEIFLKEKQKVETIVKAIENQQDRKIESSNFLINGIGNLAYKLISPKFPTLDRNFNINEKCNQCHLCEKICPVQNIKIMNAKPSWQGNCEHCLACIQWCPQEAIQYGKRTTGRKRYHHPEVSSKEFFPES